MSASLKLFETPVDMNLFNKILTTNGGSAIKSNSNKITMRHFIFKLIKTFKKDFMKKTKRGGMADLYNDTDVSYATNYTDLSFSPYKFEPYVQLERDIL
jgi:hypothetical protein